MNKSKICGIGVVLLVGLQHAFAFDVTPTQDSGDAIRCVKCEKDYVTLMALDNGSLTVDEVGEIDILLVGGGGGGGASNGDGGGAGGGAGGFVYRQSFSVTPGTYEVKVGRGGSIGSNGGDSTAFGLIAHGGGHGANHRNTSSPGDGGSGGGATATYSGEIGECGQALGIDDNLGNAGGSVPSEPSYARYRRAGGGGGAGEAGHVSVEYGGGGGKGKICSITGRAIWYAGGGAGTHGSQDREDGWNVNEATGDGVGGLGGGGNAGCKGEDGLGGGGGGDAAGGDGVVIIRYRRSEPDVDAEDFDIVPEGNKSSWVLEDGMAILFEQSGLLTITGGGYVDVMLVGGGGGGGASESEGGGAGGGAGGFLYRKGVYVAPGVYSVDIGEGGAVGVNGGNTKALGFVAYGGGCGARNRNTTLAGDGGSGGGQTVSWAGAKSNIGQAIFENEFNVGHSGGSAANYSQVGGGGGAGEDGGNVSNYGGFGGNGVKCSITGVEVWYAGGGAGTYGSQDKDGWKTDPVTRGGCGGLGGGGNAGCAGTDGLGGGGGGDAKGGSGVFVIRFAKKVSFPESYEDATGGIVTKRHGYRIHTFRETGTFTMPDHAGRVDILLVGGGGGGGKAQDMGGGAGGGAGGFVYKESVFVRAGEHTVTIGAGGAVGVNGGDSTAFGLIAHGGGHGAQHRNQIVAGDGGSGGGATATYQNEVGPVGRAIGTDDNIGNDGGSVSGSNNCYRRAGGGGGAGEQGHAGYKYGGGGGKGLACSISGSEVVYAGGGAGTCGEGSEYHSKDESTGDGIGGAGGGGDAGENGEDGLGGGGGGEARGGSGIIIIRYKTPRKGFGIIIR